MGIWSCGLDLGGGGFVIEGWTDVRGIGIAVGSARGGRILGRDSRCEGFRYGVHAVEGARQDEVVVCGDLFHGGVWRGREIAVVD